MALSQYANEAALATRYIDSAPDSVRYAEEGKGAPAPLYGRGLLHWVAALCSRPRDRSAVCFERSPPAPAAVSALFCPRPRFRVSLPLGPVMLTGVSSFAVPLFGARRRFCAVLRVSGDVFPGRARGFLFAPANNPRGVRRSPFRSDGFALSPWAASERFRHLGPHR